MTNNINKKAISHFRMRPLRFDSFEVFKLFNQPDQRLPIALNYLSLCLANHGSGSFQNGKSYSPHFLPGVTALPPLAVGYSQPVDNSSWTFLPPAPKQSFLISVPVCPYYRWKFVGGESDGEEY
jgi:hypothetical protein